VQTRGIFGGEIRMEQKGQSGQVYRRAQREAGAAGFFDSNRS
jgi:hypothetical protein